MHVGAGRVISLWALSCSVAVEDQNCAAGLGIMHDGSISNK